MKKLMIAALVLVASVVNAAETQVLTFKLPRTESIAPMADAKFQIDLATGEGYAIIDVTEVRDLKAIDENEYPLPRTTHRPKRELVNIFKTKARIEGLTLQGDRIVFQEAEREVECGTYGDSRLLRRPTIYLNGNCQLKAEVIGSDSGNVVIKMITK